MYLYNLKCYILYIFINLLIKVQSPSHSSCKLRLMKEWLTTTILMPIMIMSQTKPTIAYLKMLDVAIRLKVCDFDLI